MPGAKAMPVSKAIPMRGLSVATDRMAMDRSMTNLFLACQEERRFDGSALKFSPRGRPKSGAAKGTKPHKDLAEGLAKFRDQEEDRHEDRSDRSEQHRERDPVRRVMEWDDDRDPVSMLSPILSVESNEMESCKVKPSHK